VPGNAVLDAIFNPVRFGAEIIWKRSTAHSDTKQGRRDYGRIHDTILYYRKSDSYEWNKHVATAGENRE